MRHLGLFHRGLFGLRHPFVHVGVILVGLLILAAIVTAVVLAVRHHHTPSHPPTQPPVERPRDDVAERIVRERLARGEITEDEYRATVATLRDGR